MLSPWRQPAQRRACFPAAIGMPERTGTSIAAAEAPAGITQSLAYPKEHR